MKGWRSIPYERLAEVQARKICVIKPSAMGDIVQTIPLLPALRARFPQARITWVVKREWSDLLTGHPDLDEVLVFQSRGSLGSWLSLLSDLRRRRFDLVLDLQGLLRTGLMTMATGAPLRVGLETAREGAHLACNCLIPQTGRTVAAHARYARVAEAIGFGQATGSTTIPFSEEDRQWARSQLQPSSGLNVALHAGAAWPTKQWPGDKFAAIASRAIGDYDAAVILIGGKSERGDGEHLESVLRRTRDSRRVYNLVGQSTLKQLSALLSEVDLLVTNDSGPMHLAAGLGTPVLGIFTCTSPTRSGPPGDEHELIAAQVACAASYKKRCPNGGDQRLCCLRALDTDRVWRAFQRLVEKNQLRRAA